MFFLSLLIAGALATPAPTVPTPYPTITPAPKSQCTYVTADQGPFALDCLQQEFIAAGCSIRGYSYPTEILVDAGTGGNTASNPTALDSVKRDKEWYNQNTWGDVKTELATLKSEGNADCLGETTDMPTPNPTAPPTTPIPTPAPSLQPTTYTPAPTYPEDAAYVSLTRPVGSAYVSTKPGTSTGLTTTDASLKAACISAGFNRQYDDTLYVLRVIDGANTDYYTTTGEICDIFDLTAPAFVGTRVEGPFQAVGDTTNRATGGAYNDWSQTFANAADVGITSKRTNPSCREIVAPWDITFTIDIANTLCYGRGGRFASTASDTTENERKVALALANQLFVDCDANDIFAPDGSAFTWGGSQWDPSSATMATYVTEMTNMLCTERCPLTDMIYYPDTESCYSITANGDYAAGVTACTALGADTGSINDAAENAAVLALCAGQRCYLGNDVTSWGTASATWADGKMVDYTNFYGLREVCSTGVQAYKQNSANCAGYVKSSMEYLYMDGNNADGAWMYDDGSTSQATVCRKDADEDDVTRHRVIARACSINPGGGTLENYQNLNAGTSFPRLEQASSGFMDAASPGDLFVALKVPKELFDVRISFENSTNDQAEYDDFKMGAWTVTHDSTCGTDADYVLQTPWTVFNLGGAGGVSRLQNYKDGSGDHGTAGQVWDPDTEVQSDGSNSKYIFGATVLVQATQPLKVAVNALTTTNQRREAFWDRHVTVRIPIIVKFQKTVTVSTNVDIVSTKFNYKTVAALIQNIQYDTQYFSPPYAKIKLQIRTKSQYPYRMHDDVARHTLSVASQTSGASTTVGLTLTYLADDANCTFTNSDHMREGDVCTQEWQVDIVPQENVCYATGEYTITYETACFTGKKVCYMPYDAQGNEITTVSFTFKIQTSKFCPEVADEISLEASLAITGRNSWKPATEGVEGATVGDFYLQGETIYVIASTTCQRAKIVATSVLMVEIHQDLSNLIQTGFNRVPYDISSEEIVVWTAPATNRLATGSVKITADNTQTTVQVMTDDDVVDSSFDSSSTTESDGSTSYRAALHVNDYVMNDNEAGFRVLMHARLVPVNTDSFGTKKFVVTLQVQYEAIGNTGRRRRLLQASANPAHQSSGANIQYSIKAWQPKSMPSGLHTSASMALTMSVQSGTVSRANAPQFAQSIHNAIVKGLNKDSSTTKLIYDEQVSIDAVMAGSNKIWTRPQHQAISGNRRRMVAGRAQTLTIELTFAEVPYKNSMELYNMIRVFESQLKSPASPLLKEPIFYNAVIHELEEIQTSSYQPTLSRPTGSHLASSASVALPFVAYFLYLLW